jgi:hypothetical protein
MPARDLANTYRSGITLRDNRRLLSSRPRATPASAREHL